MAMTVAVRLSCMKGPVRVKSLDELLRTSEIVRQDALGVVLDMRADGYGVNFDVAVHCSRRYMSLLSMRV